MILAKLNPHLQEPYTIQTSKVKSYILSPIDFDIQSKFLLVGLDPGNRNMGITIILPSWAGPILSAEIRMEVERDPVKRVTNIYQTVYQFMAKNVIDEIRYVGYAVIEGASFGDKFRQVELAEARTASLMALDDIGLKITILPPISIRKRVFGKGKIRGEDVWKHLLPPNAASSLVCALCATILFCQ